MILPMIKNLFWLLFLVSCAQAPVQKDKELVSLGVALGQAEASYLKGCVDAMKDLKIPVAFPGCRDKATLHRRELDSIMDQDL